VWTRGLVSQSDDSLAKSTGSATEARITRLRWATARQALIFSEAWTEDNFESFRERGEENEVAPFKLKIRISKLETNPNDRAKRCETFR
jgi:hypothetical protein